MSHHLDTKDTFHQYEERPCETKMADVMGRVLKDGSVELVCKQSTKKYNGKRWASQMVTITLTPVQAEAFRKAIEAR